MVHLYRLMRLALLLLLAAPFLASAAVPKVTTYQAMAGSTKIGAESSSFAGACSNAAAYKASTQTAPSCNFGQTMCTYAPLVENGTCYTVATPGGARTTWSITSNQTCPIGSALVGGSCQCLSPLVETAAGECKLPACPVGQHEEGGACVPDACKPNETRVNGVCVPEPPCPAGQTRVNGKCVPSKCPSKGTVSDQWYEVTTTSQSATCLYNSRDGTYCTMSITPSVIATSGGRTTYMGGYGVYTGGTCGPSEPGKPVPVDPDDPDGDPDKGTKPPGPNDPKPDTKPGGNPGGPGNNPTPPGPDGKCPEGTYKSNGGCYPKDPPTQPPDSDGKCPNGYVKVGDKCVPLMPTPDKEPGEEEDPSSFGGQCESVTCDGDAIQCAIARDQYKRSCELMEKESAESQLYASNKGKDGNQTGELPGNETISLSGRIDTSDALGGGSCFGDLSITVWKEPITLPLSQLCQYLAMLGNILVAVSMLMAARIVTRG